MLAVIVTKLPGVPLTLKLVTVCVVLDVKTNAVGWTVLLRVVIVLEPETVRAPAPALFTVQFHVEPPPANVFVPAFVKVIVPVPVPAVVVNPVGALLVIPEPVCWQLIVPPLNVMFLVPVSVKSCAPGIKVRPLKLSVPFVSLKIRVDPKVKLSKS